MAAIHPGKDAAARLAVSWVQDGMALGLGTGSTAELFVRALGERVRAGLKLRGTVATSEVTAKQARAEGIEVTTLETLPRLDLAVDGADAIDPDLNLVKGLGGALLREKIVALASARFVVIADESKRVEALHRAPVVPVEVVQFGWTSTRIALEALGARPTRRARKDAPGEAFVTDGGNYILDCAFGEYPDPGALAARVKAITGVVDHGWFIGMAREAVLGADDGTARVITPRGS